MQLGNLQRVRDLHSVWKNEAYDLQNGLQKKKI